MTQIHSRLQVDGPDRDSEYELTVEGETWTYIWLNRQQADALIVALGGTPPPVAITEAEWRDLGRPAGEDE